MRLKWTSSIFKVYEYFLVLCLVEMLDLKLNKTCNIDWNIENNKVVFELLDSYNLALYFQFYNNLVLKF